MFSKINFGMKVTVALLLLALPAVCTVYGMMPPYVYWKNCLSTGSCAAALFVLGALNPRFLKTGFLMIFGLIFSMIGDGFMKQGNMVGGIGFFGLGHICFLAFFLANGTFRLSAAIAFGLLLAGYVPYYLKCLKPLEALSGNAILNGAVIFYLVVSILSLTATFAFNTTWWVRILAILGISCIVFSDTLIAENNFCGRNALYFLMMPTYLATHFLIAAAAVFDFVLVKNAASAASSAITSD